ncbi:MAG: type II toxin-antitoxin system HipA family toxin [Desulfobacteraceae bacterium]|nr:type II toxin-antitoxin system HipA family toxin [Desulfobacteraceae bacterium]
MTEYATVRLWGQDVGYIAWDNDKGYSSFEYEPKFLKSGLDFTPFYMNLDEARRGDIIFTFPENRNKTFLGLPGVLADALPDKFGNRVINTWLARNGRKSESFTPIERLCYIGTRGMGALEFFPQYHPTRFNKPTSIKIQELVSLAQDIMDERNQLDTNLGTNGNEKTEAMMDILKVGISAGGARPKAVIAMNGTGSILSGQGSIPEGYDHWLLKFDGVTDQELGEPKGYGRIEFAYYLMAKDAGIDIKESQLLEEGGRAHFMTKRFDRNGNEKIHMLSFCGMAHYDFNKAGEYSYEQLFSVMRELKDIGMQDITQQYRRILFNVIARNQDDHTKNISFLMTQDGIWKLSPAYDVTYSYNPDGLWTNVHQMSLCDKRDNFTAQDLLDLGSFAGISNAEQIIDEILETVKSWPEYAKLSGVEESQINAIQYTHRVKSIKNSLDTDFDNSPGF